MTTANPKDAVKGRRRRTATVRTMKRTISHISHVPPKCRRIENGSIFIFEFGGAIVRSAVPTVRVAACDGDALGVTVEGETKQLIVAGALQLSSTGWLKPLPDITLIA